MPSETLQSERGPDEAPARPEAHKGPDGSANGSLFDLEAYEPAPAAGVEGAASTPLEDPCSAAWSPADAHGEEGVRPLDPALEPWADRVHGGDCLELMAALPDASIDMVCADLPYGTTRNRWDSVIDLGELWRQYRRIVKPDGAIVLTAAQPFTAVLTTSNLEDFRYEWIWQKTIGSGQLNIKRQPLRMHESVLVFYRRLPTYHPQMTEGVPYRARRRASAWNDRGYSDQRDHETVNEGVRYPTTVLRIANPRIRDGHPTQKPVQLFEYLIRTYTDPGEVVLDNVIGSGTTAVAAVRSGRHFIGMERDAEWLERSRQRAAAALASPETAE